MKTLIWKVEQFVGFYRILIGEGYLMPNYLIDRSNIYDIYKKLLNIN